MIRKAKTPPKPRKPKPPDTLLRFHVTAHQLYYLRQLVAVGLHGETVHEVAYELVVHGLLDAAKHRLVVLTDESQVPLTAWGSPL